MNRHVFEDKAHRFTRISKQAAKKLYNSGEPFKLALCPVNLRPRYPRSPHYPLTEQKFDCWDKLATLDDIARDFEWYNCTLSETGYYAAFYIMEDK